jgi:NAD-dependent DNA ligase
LEQPSIPLVEAWKRAAFLRTELERHNRLYYVEAAPEISDREFDALLRELQDLESAHPGWPRRIRRRSGWGGSRSPASNRCSTRCR